MHNPHGELFTLGRTTAGDALQELELPTTAIDGDTTGGH